MNWPVDIEFIKNCPRDKKQLKQYRDSKVGTGQKQVYLFDPVCLRFSIGNERPIYKPLVARLFIIDGWTKEDIYLLGAYDQKLDKVYLLDHELFHSDNEIIKIEVGKFILHAWFLLGLPGFWEAEEEEILRGKTNG